MFYYKGTPFRSAHTESMNIVLMRGRLMPKTNTASLHNIKMTRLGQVYLVYSPEQYKPSEEWYKEIAVSWGELEADPE